MEQFAEAARVAAKRAEDAKVIEHRLAKHDANPNPSPTPNPDPLPWHRLAKHSPLPYPYP